MRSIGIYHYTFKVNGLPGAVYGPIGEQSGTWLHNRFCFAIVVHIQRIIIIGAVPVLSIYQLNIKIGIVFLRCKSYVPLFIRWFRIELFVFVTAYSIIVNRVP